MTNTTGTKVLVLTKKKKFRNTKEGKKTTHNVRIFKKLEEGENKGNREEEKRKAPPLQTREGKKNKTRHPLVFHD